MSKTSPQSIGAGASRSGAVSFDPAALMRIQHLPWRARGVVQGFLSGLHKSPAHGFSVEFTEYRPYTPGDDLRFLDWKLLARSDRLQLKQFEDETNRRCWLLVDQSRSMGFGTQGYSKADYARTAAATLAWFLAGQRDAVGLLGFDVTVRQYLPARFRPGHLRRLLQLLEQPLGGTATDLAAPLTEVTRLANRRGLVVLLSDLLAPLDLLATRLSWLRARGHEVLLLRILDPRELDFDLPGEALFTDLETGRELHIDPVAAREGYHQKFAAHADQLRQICGDLGIDLTVLTTATPLHEPLVALLQSRARGAGGRRPGSAGLGTPQPPAREGPA